MSSPRYNTHCPVCDGPVEQPKDYYDSNVLRHCRACKFQWSTEEPEASVIGRAAAARARQQEEGL